MEVLIEQCKGYYGSIEEMNDGFGKYFARSIFFPGGNQDIPWCSGRGETQEEAMLGLIQDLKDKKYV